MVLYKGSIQMTIDQWAYRNNQTHFKIPLVFANQASLQMLLHWQTRTPG